MGLSLFNGRRLPVGWLAFAAILFALTALGAEPQTNLITGNHSPTVEKLVGASAAPSDQMLSMRIDLNPSHRDELEALLAAQQDPSSPSYHQWLKTGEFDRRFGPDPDTRTAIAQWLKQQGFEVSQTPNGRGIKFTGTIEQAQRAFNVAIYSADNGKHYGNLGDPAVPSQLAPSIAFIDGLDNLRGSHTGMHVVPGSPADRAASSPLAPVAGILLAESDRTGQPDVTLKGKTGFGPPDFYTFYDVNSLLKKSVTGTGGGCIGLIEVSDYPDAGLTNFDSAFKLATPTVTRVIALDSDNPGASNNRTGETMLDVEYSHTFAPGAAIKVYLSDPATFGGNDIEATVDALNTAVADNSCSSLSISIESCGIASTYYTGALHTTYVNAAMQGQTVFVAEGDEGAAEFQFDPSTDTCVVGTTRNVNELASDPNITSIGGTQFKPNLKTGNDVGFVAESVWNEGMVTSTIGSGGGGASTVWPKSAAPFQATGTPDDGARDVPDISMEAACHTPGAFSVFPGQSTGNNVSCCACGTSLGAPVWAGIAELMVQSNGNQRIGSLNTQLYKLGLEQDTATTGIRDVTMGNNDFNGVTGFDAVAGYDQASGWGTPDVATFVPAFLGQPVPTPEPTATPVPGKLKVAPTTLNFGKVVVNTTSKPKTIKLSNIARPMKKQTAMPITIESASVTSGAPFTVTNNGCSAPLEAKGPPCDISVTFTPTGTTPATATLTITDNVPGDSTATVKLEGTGEAAKK